MTAARKIPVARQPLEHRAKTLERARAELRTVTIAETRAHVECVGISIAEIRQRLRAGARVERETLDVLLGELAQVLVDVQAVLDHRELLDELTPRGL